ncbi:MAG: choice-of-anchor E domain-containing protein [Isosphaeraceae bacterium]
MYSPRMWLGVMGAGFALFFGISSARADYTITQSPPAIPLTQTNWSPTTTTLAGVNPFVFQKFDASKYSSGGLTAVLTRIDLKLDYEFQNTLQVRFDNVATITVSAQGSMNLNLPSGNNALPTSPSFSNSATLSSKPSDVFSKFVTLPTQVYSGSQSASYTDQGTLAQFLGTGTVGMPVFASANSNFNSSSGNGFGSSVTYASAQITMVMTYVLVPEPSSIMLTGFGLLGLTAVAVKGRPGMRVKEQPAV